jgi:hypothetical protein
MGTNRLLPAIVPLLALTLGGCRSGVTPLDAGDGTTDRPSARIDLGSGQLHWEDLSPTARVELIHGPQGGWHIFGRVRFDRLGPAVAITFRVTPLAGGAPLNDPLERIRLAEGRGLVVGNGAWESSNALLVVLTTLRSEPAAAAVVGQRFRFETTVTSIETGQSATTAREITIVNDT